ncbi:MAG TPA: hypothetical protein DDW52_14045 [Planctomycetaceae bacterium]|nr:hypothetical protein [Planctomycetaceae bacterium]
MTTLQSNSIPSANNAEVRHPGPTASHVESPEWDLGSLGARWAAVYELASTGAPTLLCFDGEVSEADELKASQLAVDSIMNQRSKLCSLSSDHTSILNVEPIPGTKRCLAAVFNSDLAVISEQEAVAQLAAVKNFINTIAEEPNAAIPPPSVKSADEIPSWRSLATLLIKKLQHDFDLHRRNARTYIAVLAAVVAVCFVPIPFRISCSTRCEPVLSRFVAAPFTTRLEQTHAEIGQRVNAGDLLATLDGGEIIAELASLRDKANQAKQRQLAALSSGDHSEAAHERLELEQIAREIALLERRQSELEIRAPIDGIIVDGDLERAQGTPLDIGQTLFEIASLSELVAEVAVPERDIRFVRQDLPASVTFSAASSKSVRTKIERIHLRSEIREADAVFIAEAPLDNSDGTLRPGMTANTMVYVGYRPLAWVALHRPWHSLRQWIGR